jgi:general secretion pathway protein D
MVEAFGTVRALSSPRLAVMQNQTAVLKVAKEQVFFELQVEPGTQTGDGVATAPAFTSTVNTVTVGLVMTVLASINRDTDEITLTLRPTITSVASFVNDPAVDIEAARAGAAGVTSPVPEVTVQEIDTVISLQSGSVVVIGGLMQDRSTVDETGIPGLSDLPWIGSAFKSKSRNTEKSELVIFLRATIIRNDPIDPYDIDLYQLFGGDRRPLEF